MIKNLFLGVIVLSYIYGCADQHIPMNYIRNGEKFSCNGLVIQPGDTIINCYDKLGNKILVDTVLRGELNNTSVMRHSSGNLKLKGKFLNGYQVGVWEEYYDNGIFKEYNYFDTLSRRNTYRKTYDENGELHSLIYPINVSINNNLEPSVGDIIDFQVELGYSEYSDGQIVVIINNDEGVSSDTLYGDGLRLSYKKQAILKGQNILKGTLFEVYGQGEFGGERYFEYKYEIE